jgi:hypothetical protein
MILCCKYDVHCLQIKPNQSIESMTTYTTRTNPILGITKGNQLCSFIVPHHRQVQKSWGMPRSPQVEHAQPFCSSGGLRILQTSHCNAVYGLIRVQLWQDHSTSSAWGRELVSCMEIVDEKSTSPFICNSLTFDEELPVGLDILWGTDDGPAITLGLRGSRWTCSTMTTSESEWKSCILSSSSSKVRSMTLLSILCFAAFSASRWATRPDAQDFSSRILRSAACHKDLYISATISDA